MKLKNLLFGLLVCLFVGACSKDDKIPADADDNFITSVSLSVNNETYDAVIADNTITITVPYTVSLNGATATFVYTPSAKIIPDPATIMDWDVERTFRVTSFNGKTNDYTYVVVKDEIRHEGNVELKTPSDVAAFVASGATIIKGNLIIGSDAENAEEIKDISALEILKEVEGDIIIRKNYIGGTLTGLDNITSIGGLLIGSEEAPSANNQLEMVSMANLTSAKGNISIYGSGANIIEFKNLETVGGNIIVNNATQLSQILFHKLKEAGSIDFKVLPRDFSTLAFPELTTVEGDLNIQGIFGNVHTGGLTIATGNTGLTSISGLDKLSKVGGTLSIQNFEEMSSLPNWTRLTQLGGIDLYRNHKISSLDLSNIDFVSRNDKNPLIRVYHNNVLTSLITKEDLTNIDCQIFTMIGIDVAFKKINNFTLETFVKDLKLPLEYVFGNLSIDTRATEIHIQSLKGVDGFLSVEASMCNTLNVPKIEAVGGQLYVDANYMAEINFNSLKIVGCTNNAYAKEGKMTSYNINYGTFTVKAASNIEFPSLEHIGGKGLSFVTVYSLKCPNLAVIDGDIQGSSRNLTSEKLELPKLSKLSGLCFYNIRKFDNFSMFGKFIDDGQITEDNWSVTGCKYNPTWQDMKEGRYKPAE
jgi:hypothetical protein